MSTLKIALLGSPSIELDGERLELRPRKALALLAYLAVTGDSQPRDGLAALFWPETSQSEARAALSRRLSELSSQLDASWLESDRETIRLRARSDLGHLLWLDVEEFRQRLDACQAHGHPAGELCAACASQLAQAVAFWRGEFLSGFTLRDSPGFDEWQFFQAEGLRLALATALERLVQWYIGQDDPAAAIPHARTWLALDSLHEPAHRCLMDLYARLGQRAAALRQYEECRRLLAEALNVSPDEATQTLYVKIKSAAHAAAPSSSPPPSPPPSPSPSLPPHVKDNRPSATPSTTFVSRTRELAALAAALDEARAGHGQIRFVTGRAGQGKSMLVQEFVRQAQSADATLLAVTGHCNAYTGVGDPYLPFREALTLLTGEVDAKTSGERLTGEPARRLWAAQPLTIPALVEHAPDLIGPFVAAQSLLTRATSFATPRTPWLKQLTALCTGTKRLPLDESSIFSQYAEVLGAMAAAQPLLLILEDLHWVDLASSGLLFHLSRTVHNSRILILGTYRPEEVAQGSQGLPGEGSHPLAGMMAEFKRQHGAIWLDLDALTPAEGRQFVEAYVDSWPNRLDASFRDALFRHTGGHALFTVELLRALQARGDLYRDAHGQWLAREEIDWQAMPAKVEGVIEKQLARLDGAAQAILRVACVQGESFAAEIVAQVLRLDQATLVQLLSQELGRRYGLVSMEEVAWLGRERLVRYRFRHFLFQRYLYQSLDESERVFLHEAVGSALETLYDDQVAQIAVQLAHHFRQAKLPARAIDALLLAGQQAWQLSVFQEAVKHFAEGLALLETLPETPSRARQELEYLLALSSAMDAVGDFDAYEIERFLLRARALCQQLGDSVRMWPVLNSLAGGNFMRGEYHQMLAYGEEMLRVSQEQPNLEPRLMAYLILGIALQQLGDFTTSTTYLERMLAGYDPAQHYELIFQYVTQDVRGMAFLHLAANEWLLGYADQSRRHCEAAFRVAVETPHSYTRVMTLFMITWLHELRREVQETSRQVAEVIRLATEHQFFFVLSHARIYEGWALIEQNQAETGLARLQQGLAELHANSQTKNQGYFATLQARGHIALGQSQAGLEVIDAALAVVDQSGEHWYDAELHRLKGELLLMQGEPADIVQDIFEEAIAIARHQQAKAWELRATVSLCRLLQAQERFALAQARLVAIYDWFTEGFDTAELLEAKALLEELAPFSGDEAHVISIPDDAKEITGGDRVDVHLLGGFRMTLNGQPLTCPSQSRQQSLLAYLMLHADSPQSRQHLAFCFWPDSSEERAYANLRYSLHQLRRSCPGLKPFLEITQATVKWCGQETFRLDVAEYQALLQQANEAADLAQACKRLIQATNLYQGDLLPSCYDEWIIPMRERLSQTHMQTLQKLVDGLVTQGKYQSAIDYASQLRSYDPYRELSYRRLMELYEATGDRAAALRVYHECQSILARELGVEPGPKTRAVYERIMNPPVSAVVTGEKLAGRQEER
ncbi:MAG: AAA family ATPase [Caldilineaceae bacterium]|nr:AAA family ATPase [Caldilineaceae bacterium]